MGKLIALFLLAVAALDAQSNNLTTTVTQRYFNNVRRNLEAAADAMPADKYSYRLTEGQMTFGEWINHSTERNYADCATLKSEPAPEAAKQVPSLKEKAEVAQGLKASLAYCASALENLNDEKALATPQSTYAVLHIIVHNNEIYGNIAGYLRSTGIVPPSTANRATQKKK